MIQVGRFNMHSKTDRRLPLAHLQIIVYGYCLKKEKKYAGVTAKEITYLWPDCQQ